MTWAKKNYATIQELQEGNSIDPPMLDVKGLAFNKSGMNNRTKKELKRILYEDILNVDHIDQMKVVAKIACLEDDIYKSLANGEKDFYRPASFKSIDEYVDPMSEQPIKGAIVWNTIRDDSMPPFNLNEKNSVDVLKLDINRTNVKKIKDEYPEVYNKVCTIIGDPDNLGDKGMDRFKNKIDAISIPKDSEMPKWLSYFIDYPSIVTDNLSNFPLESIGINKPGSGNINYSNMISF